MENIITNRIIKTKVLKMCAGISFSGNETIPIVNTNLIGRG